MKAVGGIFLAALLAASGFSQQATRNFGSVIFPGGTSATNPNITRSFGSVVFPGGSPTSSPVRSGLPLYTPRPASTGGNSFTGNGNSFRHSSGSGRGGRSTPTVYAYPVYVGGGGYYGEPEAQVGAPQAQQPNVTVVMPPREEVRPIIIQMGPEGEYRRSRQAEPAAFEPAPSQPETETPNYLIAFKDHTVYSSVAYWFDADTLHYFTKGNTHNQASVSLIDRQLTERLNREMGNDFKLPSTKE